VISDRTTICSLRVSRGVPWWTLRETLRAFKAALYGRRRVGAMAGVDEGGEILAIKPAPRRDGEPAGVRIARQVNVSAREAMMLLAQSSSQWRCALRVVGLQIERVSSAIRRRGLSTLLKSIMRGAVSRSVRPVMRAYVDWRFDRSLGMDTGGIVPVRDMGLRARRDDGEQYEATWPGLFREMIGTLALDCSKYSFVDLGCGKGRALLLAAEAGFKQVIGVEISPVLSHIAQQNVDRLHAIGDGKSPCRVVCMDAADYQFPDGPCVLYLYNPFKGETLQRVVGNLGSMHREQGHEIVVLYYNPIWQQILLQGGFLQHIKGARSGTSDFVVYRTLAQAMARSRVGD
jgi:SAM-dependent methyltransferase